MVHHKLYAECNGNVSMIEWDANLGIVGFEIDHIVSEYAKLYGRQIFFEGKRLNEIGIEIDDVSMHAENIDRDILESITDVLSEYIKQGYVIFSDSLTF